jgi:uncharacterized protein (DUF885 family)
MAAMADAAMSDDLMRAILVLDDAFREYSQSAFVLEAIGAPLSSIPQISHEDASRRTELGLSLIERISALDGAMLPPPIRTALELAERLARSWSHEADWYWLVFDARHMGYLAMFAPTSYGGGSLINRLHSAFPKFVFNEAGDLDRYLGLVSDYGRLIRQMHERTTGQAERGIRMPAPQVAQAEVLLKRFRADADRLLRVDHRRTVSLAGTAFADRVEQRIADTVLPSYDAFLADLRGPLADDAPEMVGLAQYPGGEAVYAELVKLHTTVEITPEEVHAIGLERIERIREQMETILAEVGFDGVPADYIAQTGADPAWHAADADGLRTHFERYIARMEPVIGDYFRHTPSTDHGVRPLSDALTGSMTFGYYNAPSPSDPQGTYYFNAHNLANQPLLNIAALTFHELEPGHHLQMAGQQEAGVLHPLVAHSFVNAYAEGWAEYAAALAGEMGMYREPEERFGKLIMDSFLTCRLVVDTGMNALGWSLEEARAYMRANAFISEAEILTETIRYSCDIPAQSLAYKIGDVRLMAMRAEMAERLGERFDIRDFHDVVLEEGSLPLSIVEEKVRRRTRELEAIP